MKKYLVILLLTGVTLISACGQQDNKMAVKDLSQPKTWQDTISYFIGLQIGQQLAKDSLQLNYDYYIKAIDDQMHGKTSFFSEGDVQKIGKKFQEFIDKRHNEQQAIEESKQKALGEKNLVLSKKFLEENKKKPGIIETASGIQYKILKDGNGKKPVKGDMISFHVRAFDMNGKKFDDSYERKQPIQLPLEDGLLKGWVEVLQMMKVGSKWRIWLPPSLAFGDQGIPGKVEPQMVTIWEIELMSIDGKAPKKQGMPTEPVKPLPPGM